MMKRISIILLLICLQCGKGFGQILTFVDAPQDNLQVFGNNCTNFPPELKPLTLKYNELLQVRFWPLTMKDVDAIFGPKLDQKPADRVKPLFVPRMIGESGLMPAVNKRHIDFHTIGNIGYLEVHYNWDGESVATAVIYLRADDQFVPLRSTNDVSRREAWDQDRYNKVEKWLDVHLPKLIDLGVVDVTPDHPTNVDLGGGVTGIIKTRKISNANVPYWLSILVAKDINDLNERSAQRLSVDRTNEPVGFTIDGKFYRMTPQLVAE